MFIEALILFKLNNKMLPNLQKIVVNTEFEIAQIIVRELYVKSAEEA